MLDGIDLQVLDGEAHAVLGGSGAGKTTLLNLLSGLLRPTEGRISFAGRDVADIGPAGRNLAQVFQFPVLYPALDVAGNLAFPLRNRGWRGLQVRRRVAEVAELLGLTPLLQRKPKHLSLFEKQMTAIGRALVRPDLALVLLDEPLTAVAPTAKWRLRRALTAVRAQFGLTMIYVTHDQTEALTFADRISMLHQGRVLQAGTPQDLYERPAGEVVAKFIGAPGMNLVKAQVLDGQVQVGGAALGRTDLADGPCTLGFRPEWAAIGRSGVPLRIRSSRAIGSQNGAPTSLISAELDGQLVHVRQPVHQPFGYGARLHIDPRRMLLYRNGLLVGHGGKHGAAHHAG